MKTWLDLHNLNMKAFDCVDHNKLWKILKEMENLGLPHGRQILYHLRHKQLLNNLLIALLIAYFPPLE